MRELSDATGIPHDLLLQPALVRSAAALPDPGDPEALEDLLVDFGARQWQRELSLPVLVDAARSVRG